MTQSTTATRSLHSLFLAALKTRLAGIVAGADFWNTLLVVRVPGMADHYLDASVNEDAICFMVPGADNPRLNTFGTMASDLRVDLLLARRYEAGDDPFHQPTIDRWEEQDKLRQDVTKRLEQDPKVSQTCFDLQITHVEMEAEQTWHETWACVFMSLLAVFHYPEGAP